MSAQLFWGLREAAVEGAGLATSVASALQDPAFTTFIRKIAPSIPGIVRPDSSIDWVAVMREPLLRHALCVGVMFVTPPEVVAAAATERSVPRVREAVNIISQLGTVLTGLSSSEGATTRMVASSLKKGGGR
jgi:hypothetical protein